MRNRVARMAVGASIQINSRAVSTHTVSAHVCLECRLFPLMRLDRLNLGASIESVLVHCSKPVFSEFGASAAVTHGPFYRRGCDHSEASLWFEGDSLQRAESAYNSGHYGEPFLRCNQLQNPTVRDHRRTKISRPRYSRR